MKSLLPAALGIASALALATMASCDDTTTTIGSSLTGQNVKIVIDSAYTVTGHAFKVTSVSPRTSNQIFGRIEIPGYGSLSSDVVAQFLPSTQLDTANFTAENIDSVTLRLQYARGAFLGDSVAPMGITVYPLKKQLPSDMSSSFDPDGYYSSTPLATKVYNTSTFYGTATEKAAAYRNINVPLPVEFARDLFNKFEEDPSSYLNGQVFAEDVFPGIYITNSFGSGRLTTVSLCGIIFHLSKITTTTEENDKGETVEKADTTKADHLYYMVTPEVLNNNNIRYAMAPELSKMLDEGHNVMVAPTGTELEITLPTPEIISRYRAATENLAVINGLTLDLPVDTIANGYGVTPPPYVLLVLKKDRDEFFAKNKLPDNITSFYATYSETTHSYSFGGMRGYITEMLSRDEITPDDYTFSVVPVQVDFENRVTNSYYSTSTVAVESEMYPYIAGPAMADFRLNDAKIKFVYSLQTQK